VSTWFRKVRLTWTEEEGTEYDDAMAAAWADRKMAPESRIDIFLKALADGRQAHRVWPRDVERQAIRRGAWSLMRSWKQSRPAPLEIGWNGQVHLKSPMIGVRERAEDGTVVDQQVLVYFATFGQLRAKLPQYLQQVKAYELDIHLMVKLLALEDQVDDADDTWTPTQACEALGTTIQAYLALELAA
jgi:hypothetical protein